MRSSHHALIAIGISLLIALAAIAQPMPAATQTASSEEWIINGEVYTSLLAGDTIYIGGQFDYTGVARQNFALLSTTDGRAAPSPAFDQAVDQILADGQGGWLARGLFTKVGGTARAGLARIRADGTLDPSWNPSVSGRIGVMARSGSTLYMGGTFTSINNQARSGLAAVDAISGALKSWAPSMSGPATAMLVHEGKLYVIEDKPTGDGSTLRAFDVASGQALSSVPIAINGEQINVLAISGQTIFLGGSFIYGDGDTYNFSNLAALEITSGAPRLLDFDIGGYDGVRDLVISGTTLYVAGGIERVGDQDRRGLAAFDTLTGSLTAWNPQAIGGVVDLEIVNQQLYAAGSFEKIFGQQRANLAVIDLPSGTLNPNGTADIHRHASSIAIHNGVIAVGGWFDAAGGVLCRGVVSLDATSGALRQWCPNLGQGPDYERTYYDVQAFAVKDNTVYIGGLFEAIDSAPRRGLAAADRITGAALPWDPKIGGNSLGINNVIATTNAIFVSGSFSTIGGVSRNGLAAVDPTTSAALPWNPNLGQESAGRLVLDGSRLYVQVYGNGASRLVALDAATGSTVWSKPTDNGIYAILPLGERLLIGGPIVGSAGEQSPYLASINKVDGSPGSWAPQVSGTGFPNVEHLVAHNGLVYASGLFSSAGGQPRSNAAAFDANSGALAPWSPRSTTAAPTIIVSSSAIYITDRQRAPESSDSNDLSAYQNIIQRYPLSGGPATTATTTRTTTASPAPTCTATATATATRTATATATRTSTPTLTPRAGQRLWLPQVKGAARQAGGC